MLSIPKKLRLLTRGGSRIFSRAGDFQKIRKFVKRFRRSTKLIFRALPEHCKNPILTKFCVAGKFLRKKLFTIGVLYTFWKIFDQKVLSFFFGAHFHSLLYFGAQGSFRKTEGFVSENGYHKIIPKGGPLIGEGVESL